MWFVTWEQMKPSSLKALWSVFDNKKPPPCLPCSVLSHETWIWIFAVNSPAQPWSLFHTFDLCFLILPEAEGKWVTEARLFFLCSFWWLGFLFSHCARCVHAFCLVLRFFHYYTEVAVGSLCPWTLNFCSYQCTCLSIWPSLKML